MEKVEDDLLPLMKVDVCLSELMNSLSYQE